MSDSITATAEYNELLDSIKRTIAAGRLRAARAVNNVLVETYWEIGRDIVVRRREQGWGAKVTDRLAADLRIAHPDMRGLSGRNLRYMATLASRWPDGIGQRSVAQLPWGLVATLLDNCPDQETSEFYAKRAAKEGWTRPVLLDLLFYHCRLHRYVVFELKLGRFEPEAVGRDNVEVALRDIGTSLAVSEWRRLPAEIRQALPSAEEITETATRTVREIESSSGGGLPVSTTTCSWWTTSMYRGRCSDTEFNWSLIDLRPLRSC
jgi:predicted nuclease of restriction endonuclease-like (RecB) superfamily